MGREPRAATAPDGGPDPESNYSSLKRDDDAARLAASTPTGFSPGDGPAGAAASSSSTAGESAAVGLTETEVEAAEVVTKKRKTGTGGRGVANLTPEQLAKKRANDREAQRAIRERTKNQIEKLERRIHELENQKPYQELQSVVRAKEAVELENAEIKRRLASVIGMLQPLLGSNTDQAYSSLEQQPQQQQQQHQSYAASLAALQPNLLSYHSAASASPASPATVVDQPSISQIATPQQPVQSWQAEVPGTEPAQAQAPVAVTALEEHIRPLLEQQRQNHRNGLQLEEERLELGVLLAPGQTVPKMPSGDNGAQDSGDYKFIPMKHDWSSVNAQAQQNGDWEPTLTSVPMSLSASQHGPDSTGSSPEYLRRDTPGQQSQHAFSPSPGPGGIGMNSGMPVVPVPHTEGHGPDEIYTHYAASLRNCEPTCPLDFLLMDFISERRQRSIEGYRPEEIAGPRYPSVSSLLNPARGVHSHPLSKFLTDIIAKFPIIHRLPERVAVLWVMFTFMRWRIMPTRENFDRLPKWMAPVEVQFTLPHPLWFDHVPFPGMREKMVRMHGHDPKRYAFDDFFLPFLTTMELSWPYGETDALLQHPETNELMLNPVYESHLRNLDNWRLGRAFAEAYPELNGTYKYQGDEPQPGLAGATTAR